MKMTALGCATQGRRLVFAMLLTALATGSRADSAAPPAAAPPAPPLTVPRPDVPDAAAQREANLARIRDTRLEQLHAGLQLAPDQERLWPAVADAIRGFDAARGRRFRRELDAAPDPIAGLEMQGDHMAKVGVAMSQLAKAARPLVATFTPQQKAKLPTLLKRAPLKKVVARAFGMPLEQDGAGPVPPAPGAAAAPGKPAGETGASPQQKKDPDDDD